MTHSFVPYDSDAVKSVGVLCPDGKVVLGGGGQLWKEDGELAVGVSLRESYPFTNVHGQNGWRVQAEEHDSYDGDWKIRPYAICATVD